MARVLVTSRLAMKSLNTTWRDLLHQAGHEVVMADVPEKQLYPTETQLIDLLRGITATVASSESYTRTVLESAPDLRVVSRVGVGYDAIDTAAAADHNVVAMIAAGSNDTTVAPCTGGRITAALSSPGNVTSIPNTADPSTFIGASTRSRLVPMRVCSPAGFSGGSGIACSAASRVSDP